VLETKVLQFIRGLRVLNTWFEGVQGIVNMRTTKVCGGCMGEFESCREFGVRRISVQITFKCAVQASISVKCDAEASNLSQV
jgi:hypothetical protein